MAFDFVDDGCVVQCGAVMAKVDGLGGGCEEVDTAAGVVVAFFEGCEGGGGLAF